MLEAVVHTDSLTTAPRSAVRHKVQADPAKTATASQEAASVTPETPATDSLRVQTPVESAVDRSTALPYTVYGTAESLHTEMDYGPVIYRNAEARELFGALSTTAPMGILPRTAAPSLTANTAFQGFVLLLAAIYALLVSHNLSDVRMLLTRVTHDPSMGTHLSEGPGGSGFARFLNTTTTLGMLFAGVLAVKYADQSVTLSEYNLLPYTAVLGLSLLVAVICAVLVFYQWLALRLIGSVTLSGALISQLFYLKRTFFSLAVIITSPIVLLYALCPRGTGDAWFFVVAIQLAITVILYLKESLNLFISKKISILHWFLYLCAIEIFPLSLLWLLAVR